MTIQGSFPLIEQYPRGRKKPLAQHHLTPCYQLALAIKFDYDSSGSDKQVLAGLADLADTPEVEDFREQVAAQILPLLKRQLNRTLDPPAKRSLLLLTSRLGPAAISLLGLLEQKREATEDDAVRTQIDQAIAAIQNVN